MDGRVSTEVAAAELRMDVTTLRGLMQQGRLPIGYALRKEGKKHWGYYIYRGKLDKLKEELGITDEK